MIAELNPTKAPDSIHLSGEKLKFATGLLNGLSQTQAAIEAGWDGDPRSAAFRKACSEKANAKKVRGWLEWAKAQLRGEHGGETHEDVVKRLWGEIYSSNPVARDKAVTQLIRLGELHPNKSNEREIDPADALTEIARIHPELAARLAADEGFPIDEIEDAEALRRVREVQAKVAKEWIRDHAQEAFDLSKFFAVHSLPAKTNGASA